MKKLFAILMLCITFVFCAIGFTACGEKGDTGEKGEAGVGIVSVEKTSSDGLFDTYTIIYSDESESAFVIANGANGVGVQTAVINLNNELVITLTDNTVLNLGNVKGDKGDKGDTGVSVLSIEKTGNDGLVDTYTITFSDETTTTFTITNGAKGDKGDTGTGIKAAVVNEDNELVITLTDNTVLNLGNVKGDKGNKGDKGDKGDTGVSVLSIEKTGNDGLVDTYTITFSDETTTTFTITNGAKGDKGDKGDTGTGIKAAIVNGNNELVITLTDNTVLNLGNVKGAKGDKGDKGETGDKGDKGDTGVGIENIEIDYTGHVKITCTNGDTYTVAITEPTHEHNFDKSITFPTCENKGYTTYTCSVCGYSYINNYTPATGHHFYNEQCVFCGAAEPYGEIEQDVSWYNGSSSTFYISTKYQLAGLSYLVNHGTDFSGKTVYLSSNIDLSYAEWIPIGTSDKPFKGTFDGQNLAIYNMKINKQQSNLGLFGYVSGTVKNFSVLNADVVVSLGDYENIAIACGYSENAVSGVKTSGTLYAPYCSYVGGVVGKIVKTGTMTISNLTNNASVTGQDYTAGIIGYYNNEVSLASAYIVYIQDIENDGNIIGGDYCGGIFGYLKVNNTNTANVNASSTVNMMEMANSGNVNGGNYVGGLIGYAYARNTNTSKIEIYSNTGVITATGNYDDYIGYKQNISYVD